MIGLFTQFPNGTDGEFGSYTCPSCGLRGVIDKDQAFGLVSINCPRCDYHETHVLVTMSPVDRAGNDEPS